MFWYIPAKYKQIVKEIWSIYKENNIKNLKFMFM